jgi:hypothetical protein
MCSVGSRDTEPLTRPIPERSIPRNCRRAAKSHTRQCECAQPHKKSRKNCEAPYTAKKHFLPLREKIPELYLSDSGCSLASE